MLVTCAGAAAVATSKHKEMRKCVGRERARDKRCKSAAHSGCGLTLKCAGEDLLIVLDS